MTGHSSDGISPRRDLFIASFLFLFLELTFIRWLPAQVLFLTFFTNTVLLASFLGLSLGCLASSHRRNYLPLTVVLLIVTITCAAGMEWVRENLQDMIDVGKNTTSPQVVFFSAEVRSQDVARFVIPMELVAGFFFLLVATTMLGIGQALGRGLRALANPVEAYSINIGGSLAGVALFSLLSWRLPPVYWFAIVVAGLAYFLVRDSPPRWWAAVFALAAPFLLLLPEQFSIGVTRDQYPLEFWSPYYRINYSPVTRVISVNLISHQVMSSRKDPFPGYAFPHLLNRDTGQKPFQDVLIVGAGSGNDTSRALEWAGPDAHIDAVEIDPVILGLGQSDHPDRPYQDSRVTTHLTDGRNFLRSTTKKYDLIIFALVDSLVLHSSVSNLRLESYLFTLESFTDVRRRLKPDGLFVMYNYYRQGWIVSRLAKTLELVFHRPALVMGLPERESIGVEDESRGFTLLLEGQRLDAIETAFRTRGSYFVPNGRMDVSSENGFQATARADNIRFRPARVEIPADLRVATDAWPFLYLRSPMIPDLTWRGMAVIVVISALLLWGFGWRVGGGGFTSLYTRMLLLGTGFMLLETKAVVHLALIFGSTWTVNAVVFAVILMMILAGNLLVLKRGTLGVGPFFIGLLLLLILNIAVPLESFLGLPPALQGLAAGLLTLSPIFCAAVIFAKWFGLAMRPEQALAYNTAGAILGGVAESGSLLLGFQWLLAVAIAIYAVSWALGAERVRRAA